MSPLGVGNFNLSDMELAMRSSLKIVSPTVCPFPLYIYIDFFVLYRGSGVARIFFHGACH